MRFDSLKTGGVLYVVAVFQFFIFEIVAETLYPGYSVANNYISDLGATCVNPPSTASCVVYQPTAMIFDTTVFFLGLLLLVGTICVYHGTRKKPYFIVTAVADIGILLAGVFPENTGWIHADVSVVLFLFSGISLIVAWTIVKGGVFRYLVVAFGILTLYFNSFSVSALGNGGSERLLVLSILSGMLALGGYLTGRDPSPVVVAKENNEPKGNTTPTGRRLLAGAVLIAVGLGLVLFSNPIANPSHPGISGSLPAGCSTQSKGEVTCTGTVLGGNGSSTGHVNSGGELNPITTTVTIVGVLLIGLGSILVARELRSSRSLLSRQNAPDSNP